MPADRLSSNNIPLPSTFRLDFVSPISGTILVTISNGIHPIPVDRDTGRWKLDPSETQRRREIFWELYVYDSWQCLTFGRPPAFTTAHVDCKMPFQGEPSMDDACQSSTFL